MLLFKNLEKYTEETLKIEMNAKELNIVTQAMESVNVKGSDAIEFGALLKRIKTAFEKQHIKETKDANL